MKILFIGSNPSQSAGIYTPFWAHTDSAKTLSTWIDQLGPVDQLLFNNVSPNPTPDNRPLKVSEIKENLERLKILLSLNSDAKVVALGRTAEKALNMLNQEFYSMPHPSGRNRKLNDPTYIEKKIIGLKEFLKEKG